MSAGGQQRPLSDNAWPPRRPEVTDRKHAWPCSPLRGQPLAFTSLLNDGGYSGKPFTEAVEDKLSATVLWRETDDL